jgi:hypothetical protein
MTYLGMGVLSTLQSHVSLCEEEKASTHARSLSLLVGAERRAHDAYINGSTNLAYGLWERGLLL